MIKNLLNKKISKIIIINFKWTCSCRFCIVKLTIKLSEHKLKSVLGCLTNKIFTIAAFLKRSCFSLTFNLCLQSCDSLFFPMCINTKIAKTINFIQTISSISRTKARTQLSDYHETFLFFLVTIVHHVK